MLHPMQFSEFDFIAPHIFAIYFNPIPGRSLILREKIINFFIIWFVIIFVHYFGTFWAKSFWLCFSTFWRFWNLWVGWFTANPCSVFSTHLWGLKLTVKITKIRLAVKNSEIYFWKILGNREPPYLWCIDWIIVVFLFRIEKMFLKFFKSLF